MRKADETLELSDEYLESGQSCRVLLLYVPIMISINLKSSEKNTKALFLALLCTVCNVEGIARRIAAIFSPALDGRPIVYLLSENSKYSIQSTERRTTVRNKKN